MKSLTPRQFNYLESLLNSSEEDLIFEVARGIQFTQKATEGSAQEKAAAAAWLREHNGTSIPNDYLLQQKEGWVQGMQERRNSDNEVGVPLSAKEVRQAVPDTPAEKALRPFLRERLDYTRESMQAIRLQVYQLICNAEMQQPNEQALDVATGQTKDIIAAVIMVLTVEHSMVMSVAIPAVVYLLKKGLHAFCAVKPVE
jgi:hypothetical protein